MSDIPLQEHLEALTRERVNRIDGLFRAHKAVHLQEAITRDEAARRIDARLEQLNELRAEVLTDRNRLVSREAFDARAEAVDVRIDALHDQITEWKGREMGLSLSASVLVAGIGLVSTVLAIYFALT
jgi:trehalose-6-phosphatase